MPVKSTVTSMDLTISTSNADIAVQLRFGSAMVILITVSRVITIGKTRIETRKIVWAKTAR